MYKYLVTSNTRTTKNVLVLRAVAQGKKDVFDFRPGQYAAISYIKNGRPSPVRCFSIASSPSNRGELEFGIRIGGAFTRELTKLQPNDELLVSGPYGDLTLHPAKVSEAVLIAGGIGITPLLCMIRTSTARNWPIKIKLLYSTRSKQETAYASEIIRLYQNNPNFDPYFFVSNETEPGQNPRVISGPINANQIERIVGENFETKTYFLCGPPGFMVAIEKILLSKNVSPDRIISEAFGTTNKHPRMTASPRRIYLYAGIALAICFFLILGGDIIKTRAKLANDNPLFQDTTGSTSQAGASSSNSSSSVVPTQTPPRSTRSSSLTPTPTPAPAPIPPRYSPPVTSMS